MCKFIEKTEIPTTHTIMGTGVVGYGDKLDLGILGMHGSMAANHAVDECDLMLAMGTRFSDRVALNQDDFAPHAKIVQFDIDESEMRKNVMIDYEVIGDIGTELEQLLTMVEKKPLKSWQDKCAKWMEDDTKVYNNGFEGQLRPADIMEVIGKKTDGKALISTDVGQHQIWAAQFCKKTYPRGFLTSGGLGTMGFGYGAAIGAQVAKPDSPVFHITSDGSFHMNMNEACTAVSYNMPVITVILDNKVLGMVRQWQDSFYNKHFYQTQPERKTDYVKVAEGFGARGMKAETKEEFAEAVDKALAGEGPVWIVCPIDREERVLPMIPSGGTVRSVILQ